MASKDPLSYMGAVKAKTAKVAEEVLEYVRSQGLDVSVIWGYNPASKPEHSSGYALDFMCNQHTGDVIADYLWANRSRIGIRWIIWWQRIRSTSPGKSGNWTAMANRGSATANHKDHVHVFLTAGAYNPPAAKTLTPLTGHTVSLKAVQSAAKLDGPREQGGTTEGAADDVMVVENALAQLGLLDRALAGDGSYGTSTVAAYKAWQKKIGSDPEFCDGIPGKLDLGKLAKLFNFKAVA